MRCGSVDVKLYGQTSCGNQRFRCKECGYTYTFHNYKNKRHREKNSFALWITEGYSIRQLINISSHGVWKLNQIKKYWLEREPNQFALDYRPVKYLQFDGTYFKHENCLMVLMDNTTSKIITHKYHTRENYESAHQMFKGMKGSGLQPTAIMIDGNSSVIRALKTVWSSITIQRCRTHIQRQGLSWLRRYPKLEASKTLREILLTLPSVKDEKEKETFIKDFNLWEEQYGYFVLSLSSRDKVYGDLQRTRSLILCIAGHVSLP